jgi:outer membrane assembly lipoprotein YfiO
MAVLLSGCSSSLMDGLLGDSSDSSVSSTSSEALSAGLTPDMTAATENAEVAKLYNEGLEQLNKGQSKTAIKKFSEVERKYPYSSFATKAILMQAYASYRAARWDDAVIAANRFITLHPGHRDAGYAYYLVAVSNYNKIADTKRDQSATKQALAALEEVAQRYPGTSYAADAAEKAVVARDHLAGHEMEVGRYYFRSAAISPASTASSASSPITGTPARRRRRSTASRRATWRSESCPRRRRQPPCSATTTPIPNGTRTPTSSSPAMGRRRSRTTSHGSPRPSPRSIRSNPRYCPNPPLA